MVSEGVERRGLRKKPILVMSNACQHYVRSLLRPYLDHEHRARSVANRRIGDIFNTRREEESSFSGHPPESATRGGGEEGGNSELRDGSLQPIEVPLGLRDGINTKKVQ